MGVDWAESEVNPTMSLKYIVTVSYASATTDSPLISWLATDLQVLKQKIWKRNEEKIWREKAWVRENGNE